MHWLIITLMISWWTCPGTHCLNLCLCLWETSPVSFVPLHVESARKRQEASLSLKARTLLWNTDTELPRLGTFLHEGPVSVPLWIVGMVLPVPDAYFLWGMTGSWSGAYARNRKLYLISSCFTRQAVMAASPDAGAWAAQRSRGLPQLSSSSSSSSSGCAQAAGHS